MLPTHSTDAVPSLTPVPAARRATWAAGPASGTTHDTALAAAAAFAQVETGGASPRPPTGPLRIAAWNLERCLFPDASAALLRQQGAALTLLTEMDHGCHRTGQRHTTRLLAEALGQRYAFGVEFLELATMPAPLAFPGNPPENNLGFHGNGFVSALPFRDPVVIRLDAEADWYAAPRGGQRRIGTRMAIAAIFRHGDAEFLGCSVHLESDSDFAGRDRQMRTLLAALDNLAGALPVVVGGDLNTHVGAGGHDDPRELLFESARRHGYDWRAANTAWASTRPSTWSAGAGARQLDWFCTRGCRASEPRMTPALGADGTVLSDHELIGITVAF
jgi:endonuclease/exonuclease/phosphatase family metal-dependent hydrolase